MIWENKKFGILGLGKSGVSAFNFLKSRGAEIWVWDDNPNELQRFTYLANGRIIDIAIGELDAVIVSPGIDFIWPKSHSIIDKARQNLVPIISDFDLFFLEAQDKFTIAVTGSNGKSTTTALIGHILKEAGVKVGIGGNIGIPLLDLGFAESVYVIEASSFQLEITEICKFKVGVLLNISPDHLARHGGLEGYVTAKKRIFRGNGTAVVGLDDTISHNCFDWLKGLRKTYGISGQKNLNPEVLYAENGKVFFDNRLVIDYQENKNLRGKHNAQNVAAATVVCMTYGLPWELIETGLKSFEGLPYRQQLIWQDPRSIWINDSKATNVEAALRALEEFDNILWIAGGKPKDKNFILTKLYANKIRKAFFIGEAAKLLYEQLKNDISCEIVFELTKAVTAAKKFIDENQGTDFTILFSPAAASYDQFESFEHRGEVFSAIVHEVMQAGNG